MSGCGHLAVLLYASWNAGTTHWHQWSELTESFMLESIHTFMCFERSDESMTEYFLRNP